MFAKVDLEDTRAARREATRERIGLLMAGSDTGAGPKPGQEPEPEAMAP